MNEYAVKLISETELFKNLTPKAIEFIIKNGVESSFKKGDIIYSKNNLRKSLGIMLEGSAITRKNSILMSKVEAGRIFGAASLFGSDEFVADIMAEDKCTCFFISENNMRELFKMDFTAAENYIRFLSGRLVYLNKKIDSLTNGKAEQRIADFLINNSSSENGRIRISLNFSKLAEFLNMGRASLYRILNSFEEKGIIEKDGKRIYIRDMEKLKQYL